jgi:hypothetical protein
LTGSSCVPVDPSICKANQKTTESFSNHGDGLILAIPTILAGLGFLYFIFSGKK